MSAQVYRDPLHRYLGVTTHFFFPGVDFTHYPMSQWCYVPLLGFVCMRSVVPIPSLVSPSSGASGSGTRAPLERRKNKGVCVGKGKKDPGVVRDDSPILPPH